MTSVISFGCDGLAWVRVEKPVRTVKCVLYFMYHLFFCCFLYSSECKFFNHLYYLWLGVCVCF